MKKYLYIGIAAIVVAILVALGIQRGRIKSIRAERDTYKNNTEALLTDSREYAVRDSLSAARVQTLELTLSEYKRFRANDLALIEDLNLRVKDLQAVSAAQAKTIIALSSVPKDTIIITRDSIVIPARKVSCGDAYYDFEGLITEDSFTGHIAVRDSLLLTESVEYKRFLGFLWRTRKVKSRQVDIVSRNPYTKILDIEHIVIRK